MGEQHPAGQAPSAGTGEFIDDPLTPAPEVVALLGEDVVRYMDRAGGALAELGEMAGTEDPFAHDERGHQVDLSFLKPQYAALVLNYRSNSGPFRGEPGKTVAKFGRKVVVKMPGIHRNVDNMVDETEPLLDDTKTTIKGISDSMSETRGISVLGSLRQSMEELMTARNRLPSPATMVVVDNMYAAGLSARNYVSSIAAQRHIGTPGFIRKFNADMKDGRENFKATTRLADKIRHLGTANFNWLQKLIVNERTKEALGVISAAEAARRKLPEDTDGLGDEERATIRAAESYLAGYGVLASQVLQDTRPELLQDKGVKLVLERLNPPVPEPETERPESRVTVGDGVLSKLTETKNVLRGGGRLKPGKDQTESDVRATADGLYALQDGKDGKMLDPQEAGLIVAMVTGRFDELSEVIGAVQRHERAYGLQSFPAERSSVIREICDFDLQAALAKIHSLMNDPDARLKLDRTLGIPDVSTVRECLSEALSAEPETGAAA